MNIKRLSIFLLAVLLLASSCSLNENISVTDESKRTVSTGANNTKADTSSTFGTINSKNNNENTTSNKESSKIKDSSENNKSFKKTTEQYITVTELLPISSAIHSNNSIEFARLCNKINSVDGLAKALGCKTTDINSKYYFKEEELQMMLTDKCYYLLDSNYKIKHYYLSTDRIFFLFKDNFIVSIYTKRDINFNRDCEFVFESKDGNKIYLKDETYLWNVDGYPVTLKKVSKSNDAKNIIDSLTFNRINILSN